MNNQHMDINGPQCKALLLYMGLPAVQQCSNVDATKIHSETSQLLCNAQVVELMPLQAAIIMPLHHAGRPHPPTSFQHACPSCDECSSNIESTALPKQTGKAEARPLKHSNIVSRNPRISRLHVTIPATYGHVHRMQPHMQDYDFVSATQRICDSTLPILLHRFLQKAVIVLTLRVCLLVGKMGGPLNGLHMHIRLSMSVHCPLRLAQHNTGARC